MHTANHMKKGAFFVTATTPLPIVCREITTHPGGLTSPAYLETGFSLVPSDQSPPFGWSVPPAGPPIPAGGPPIHPEELS